VLTAGLAATALLFLLAVACGGDDEEVAPQPTATPLGSGITTPIVTPTPTPTLGTPAPVPSGWKQYTDPVLGFSLSYPGDLAVTEKAPSDSGGSRERDLEFRIPEEPPRLVLVLAMVENSRGLTLDQWVLEYAACLPETIEEGTVAAKNARLCTSEPAEVPEAAVAFEHNGTMFLIRSLMPPSDFERIIASLRL